MYYYKYEYNLLHINSIQTKIEFNHEQQEIHQANEMNVN